MAMGLLIKNKWGDTVIDDNFSSMQELRSGTMNPISYNQDWSYPYDHSTRCFHIRKNPNSLLFMQPKIGQYVSAPVQMADYAASDGDFHRVYSNWADPIPFFEAVPGEAITGKTKPGWGLEIRDEQGRTRFHSGAELVAIDDYYSISGSSGDPGSPGATYREITVGANDWICPISPRGYSGFYRINGVTSGDMYLVISACARISGGKVAWRPLTYRRNSVGAGSSVHSFAGIQLFTA